MPKITVSRLLRAGACVALSNFFVLASSSIFAIPAAPFPFSEIQPDGSKITLHMRGDEHYNWMEDTNGYTVVRNHGWFEYAERGPLGRLNPNGMIVGRDNPLALGLQKRVLPSASVRAGTGKRVNGVSTSEGVPAGPQGVAPVGDIKNLVVMIRFSDHVGRSLPSATDMGILFNAVGGHPTLAPTGSIKDVYFENSYGQMVLNSFVNPGVGDWITVSKTEAFYANGTSGDSTLWQALREALVALDAAGVDFNDYDTDNDGRIDSIAFIHSGYAAEWGGNDAYGTNYADRIWSHRWAIQPQWHSNDGVSVFDYHISPGVWGTSGSNIGRIGVIAHETGHFFGLPDLYDTDGGGDGIGSWGLMANSWDFNNTQHCPPHFSPWSKIDLGWYSPMIITQPGEYAINQAETNAEVYRIDNGFPAGEYLLIENRQNAGFDCTIPQGGLAIWHIDDTTGYNTEGYPGQGGWPNNGNHYRVALLQADGSYDLEHGMNRGDKDDMYHAADVGAIGPGPGIYPNTDTYQSGNISQTGVTISNISASSEAMTFCFNSCGVLTAPDAPTGLDSSAVSDSQINLSWQDNADNEEGYRVERSDDGFTGWSPITSLGVDSVAYSDAGLTASTEYFYQVAAFNATGDSVYSIPASATTDDPLPYVDYYAQAQSTSEGTVSGSYTDTYSDNDVIQAITERESGGKPSKRRSSLSHRWTFNISPANSMTLSANAWSSDSNDNDEFQFQWSTDGSSYINAFLVLSTSDGNQQSAALPADLSGTVYVRVIDTDNSQGNRALDSVFVDYLVIQADNTPVTPPADPTGLTAIAVAHNEVNLTWSDVADDETGYEIQRAQSSGFSTIATLSAGASSYNDTDLAPQTSYDYRVRALKGAASSGFSNEASATTLDQPVGTITLTASGFKVKGKHNVDLAWDGVTTDNVEIYRDGAMIENLVDDGAYTDDIGTKGGATYQYEVCNEGAENCSNTATVVF